MLLKVPISNQAYFLWCCYHTAIKETGETKTGWQPGLLSAATLAAADHPGTTSFDQSSVQAAKWWERPRDVSRILDYLLTATKWKPSTNPNDVTAIGHSLGGWTVMLLAGAKVDRAGFEADCLIYPNPRTCGLSQELGLSRVQVSEPYNKALRDPRIKRIVSLDLGLAQKLFYREFERHQCTKLNTRGWRRYEAICLRH